MLLNFVLCIIGFVVLSYSADKMVEGASNLAEKLGISPMVIGLTVVAFGTSLPEMVISLSASFKGNPEISVGNAVGSNIMNAALILGIAAIIQPITCTKQLIRREVPIMIGSAALVWWMAHTEQIISRNEGLVLLSLFFLYNYLSYKWANQETDKKALEEDLLGDVQTSKQTSNFSNLMIMGGGLIGLIIGAEALVRGATAIAKSVGVSDEVIALTLIAIGTSLPELATSVAASRKGKSDITLGNVVGSNIFNILGIIGLAAVACSFNAPDAGNVLRVSDNMIGIHIPLMVVVSLGVLPIMSTGLKIVRGEGILLLLVYFAYTVILFQTSNREIANAKETGDLKPQKVMEQPLSSGTATITATESEQTPDTSKIQNAVKNLITASTSSEIATPVASNTP